MSTSSRWRTTTNGMSSPVSRVAGAWSAAGRRCSRPRTGSCGTMRNRASSATGRATCGSCANRRCSRCTRRSGSLRSRSPRPGLRLGCRRQRCCATCGPLRPRGGGRRGGGCRMRFAIRWPRSRHTTAGPARAAGERAPEVDEVRPVPHAPSGRCGRDHGERPSARMHWLSLLAAVLLSWLAVALLVGTIVGHGIALGARSDSE